MQPSNKLWMQHISWSQGCLQSPQLHTFWISFHTWSEPYSKLHRLSSKCKLHLTILNNLMTQSLSYLYILSLVHNTNFLSSLHPLISETLPTFIGILTIYLQKDLWILHLVSVLETAVLWYNSHFIIISTKCTHTDKFTGKWLDNFFHFKPMQKFSARGIICQCFQTNLIISTKLVENVPGSLVQWILTFGSFAHVPTTVVAQATLFWNRFLI